VIIARRLCGPSVIVHGLCGSVLVATRGLCGHVSAVGRPDALGHAVIVAHTGCERVVVVADNLRNDSRGHLNGDTVKEKWQ